MRVFSSFRFVHWVVVIAIMWASVSPTLGAVWDVDTAHRTVTVDYCDTQGHRQIAIDLPAESHSHSQHDGGAHCPFCRMADAAVALLSTEWMPVRQAFVLAADYPARFDADRVHCRAWSIASPRAPPGTV